MPQLPGEVLLCTLFADVHYYFAPPIEKPVHHRFDKRSYLYLYHDALHSRGRIEVANNAGTADQDAFNGYLDSFLIDYSYKQPTLFTVHGSQIQSDVAQWHLPAFDPTNQTKYMYKIHTVDFYLWTTDDASLLLDSLRRVMSESQMRLSDVPPEVMHARDRTSLGAMSPVVAKLENAAISSPSPYARSGSVSTTHTSQSIHQAQPGVYREHTPGSPPPTTGSPTYGDVTRQQSFTPIMAYNPAAPAAPEARAHREKTPPPPDAEQGNGLMGSQRTDAGSTSFAGPPQPTTQPRQMSFGPQAGGMSFSGPPTAAQEDPNAHFYNSHSASPAPSTYSSAPISAMSFGPPPTQSAPEQEPPSYATSSGPLPPIQPSHVPGQQAYGYGSHASHNINHDIHKIAYIPDRPVATSKKSSSSKPEPASPQPAIAGPGQEGATGKLEQRFAGLDQKVTKFEGRLNKFFKKLDSS